MPYVEHDEGYFTVDPSVLPAMKELLMRAVTTRMNNGRTQVYLTVSEREWLSEDNADAIAFLAMNQAALGELKVSHDRHKRVRAEKLIRRMLLLAPSVAIKTLRTAPLTKDGDNKTVNVLLHGLVISSGSRVDRPLRLRFAALLSDDAIRQELAWEFPDLAEAVNQADRESGSPANEPANE